MKNLRFKKMLSACITLSIGVVPIAVKASSHREAPFIAGNPQVDGTDFYMFNSYEEGREGFVTLLANYIPIQAPFGGPNYFDLDENALYQIHIDNNGDAIEDITFSFTPKTIIEDLQIPVDDALVSVPLKNIGAIGPLANDIAALNVRQTYSVDMILGDRKKGEVVRINNPIDGKRDFPKPADNIGEKSIPDYAVFAENHIFNIDIPGCGESRVFVGQRKESFFVNLGEIFDLVNTDPLGDPNAELNSLANENVTTFALEVPISCLTAGEETVIGAWTTASIRQVQLINPKPKFNAQKKNINAVQVGGAFTQVSRLGMPLVNEVVIGLKDKDGFNTSEPKDDGQFAEYVTNPTLPELLEILFGDVGAVAPNLFPRSDLISAFLTGLDGLNQPAGVVASEMLRLNTAIAPVAAADQENLGALAGDIAGFPNGRRPGDDVVDITLRVAMGALIADAVVAPNNALPFTDGVSGSAADFDVVFPYLINPIPGSPSN